MRIKKALLVAIVCMAILLVPAGAYADAIALPTSAETTEAETTLDGAPKKANPWGLVAIPIGAFLIYVLIKGSADRKKEYKRRAGVAAGDWKKRDLNELANMPVDDEK